MSTLLMVLFVLVGMATLGQLQHQLPVQPGGAGQGLWPRRYSPAGTRTENAFFKAMFLTSFMLDNTQRENFNVNIRFQWRYRTISEIYPVFTSNHNTYPLGQRDSGIILKMNYWLNV